jgi:hypothetical protein
MHDSHGIQSGHEGHGHTATPGHGTSPFSPAEVEEFHKSDRGAGKVIILLMTGIFLTGVFLYATIDILTYP